MLNLESALNNCQLEIKLSSKLVLLSIWGLVHVLLLLTESRKRAIPSLSCYDFITRGRRDIKFLNSQDKNIVLDVSL